MRFATIGRYLRRHIKHPVTNYCQVHSEGIFLRNILGFSKSFSRNDSSDLNRARANHQFVRRACDVRINMRKPSKTVQLIAELMILRDMRKEAPSKKPDTPRCYGHY